MSQRRIQRLARLALAEQVAAQVGDGFLMRPPDIQPGLPELGDMVHRSLVDGQDGWLIVTTIQYDEGTYTLTPRA